VDRVNWGRIKLLLLDCDGVLTDGGVYYTGEGDELRRFSIKDGTGIRRLLDSGIGVGIISASSATPVLCRARQLGIDEVHIGVDDKVSVALRIVKSKGINLSEVAYIGDDLADILILQIVGVPLAVGDATDRVREMAKYVTSLPGGHGAVREVSDLIMNAISQEED